VRRWATFGEAGLRGWIGAPRELGSAAGRSALSAAAQQLMHAKAELKRLKAEAPVTPV
jgi:hypothetical protein